MHPLAALLAAGAGLAGAGDPATRCADPALRCPDLVMRAPYELRSERRAGRARLRAANAIYSLGRGPLAIEGRRDGPRTMAVTQRIYTRSGGHVTVPSTGRLAFKSIPGQGRYWKFADAARFELWTLGPRRRLVRTGPKAIYCLRDLRRTHPSVRSPRSRVFPGCSQDAGRRAVMLGTSVGWADIYPAGYHEQWVDVTGLRGCFALWHIADPLDGILESDEANNAARTVVRLPFRGGAGRC